MELMTWTLVISLSIPVFCYSQKIEVFRNGTKVIALTNDPIYSYDNPIVHEKADPIPIYPGDTLSTTCYFNSEKRDTVTLWGDATNAEMCFGFITYYPKTNIGTEYNPCTSWKSLADCDLYAKSTYNDCAVRKFTEMQDDDKFKFSNLSDVCYSKTCSPACKQRLDTLITHPCMQGDLRGYIVEKWNQKGKVLPGFLELCYPPPPSTPSPTDGSSGLWMNKLYLGITTCLVVLCKIV